MDQDRKFPDDSPIRDLEHSGAAAEKDGGKKQQLLTCLDLEYTYTLRRRLEVKLDD